MQSIRKKTDFVGHRVVVVAAEGAEERMGFGQGRTTGDGRTDGRTTGVEAASQRRPLPPPPRRRRRWQTPFPEPAFAALFTAGDGDVGETKEGKAMPGSGLT